MQILHPLNSISVILGQGAHDNERLNGTLFAIEKISVLDRVQTRGQVELTIVIQEVAIELQKIVLNIIIRYF